MNNTKMLQDCLLILHVSTQILTFNFYTIQVTFVSTSISVILHFVANTIVLFLLIFCIFAWKRCGFKLHSCIALLHIAKLIIICIHFALTEVHFVLLYRSFFTVLIVMNVCTILAECMSMVYTLKHILMYHNKMSMNYKTLHDIQSAFHPILFTLNAFD